MSLRRKAFDQLLAWKNDSDRKALLVTGARQTGKTFLIREFAAQQYQHLVEINLLEQVEARQAFDQAKDAQSLFLRIAAFANAPLVPHQTLVFLDEIQECKDIITPLKFLIEHYGDSYDFVVSGSLLGVELTSIRSFPVGYLRIVEMFPLDFEEFCWTQGISELLINEARDAFLQHRPVDAAVDARLADAFHTYLIVGGMPDAVQTYLNTTDIQAVQRVQTDILNLYRLDISKYAANRARIVRRVFDLIPAELNSQGKRFIVSHIEGSARFNRYDNDVMWLSDAGVALITQNVDEPRYPLELGANPSFFKLYLSDVGLLCAACGLEVVRDLLHDRSDINYGSIYENYVAQELVAHGLCSPAPDRHLYFFRNRKLGELDFLIEWPRGRVTPLEVKSGKSYQRHSALSAALATDNYHLSCGLVLHEGNVEHVGAVYYLPMYMTMFLAR